MTFPFNPARGLIRVRAELTGPAGSPVVSLALDTGAVGTLIGLGPLRLAGYDPAAGTPMSVTTGSGVAPAVRLSVASLSALGQTRMNFPVIAHDLPPGAGVDGLLGLDFFRGQVLTIDFVNGQITLAPGTPAGPGVTP